MDTKLLIKSALTLLLTQSAFASIGESIDLSKAPPQICFLEFESHKGGTPFTCSGNLIANDMIKTAAHCTAAGEIKKITCGNSQKSLNFDKPIIPESFDLRTLGHELNNRKEDFSFIPLHFPQQITPMNMITTEKGIKTILSSPGDCAVYGFGLNEDQRMQMGYLSGSKFRKEFLKFQEDYLIYTAPYLAQVMVGDSGGALYCEHRGKWYDIGTVSGHTWDGESVFSKNSYHNSFIKKYRSTFLEAWPTPSFKKSLSQAEAKLPSLDESIVKDINFTTRYYLKDFTSLLVNGETFYNADNKYVRVKVKEIKEKSVIADIELDGYSQFYLCDGNLLCDSFYQNVEIKKTDLLKNQLKKAHPFYLNIK